MSQILCSKIHFQLNIFIENISHIYNELCEQWKSNILVIIPVEGIFTVENLLCYFFPQSSKVWVILSFSCLKICQNTSAKIKWNTGNEDN
jgi:hypothetical protein